MSKHYPQRNLRTAVEINQATKSSTASSSTPSQKVRQPRYAQRCRATVTDRSHPQGGPMTRQSRRPCWSLRKVVTAARKALVYLYTLPAANESRGTVKWPRGTYSKRFADAPAIFSIDHSKSIAERHEVVRAMRPSTDPNAFPARTTYTAPNRGFEVFNVLSCFRVPLSV